MRKLLCTQSDFKRVKVGNQGLIWSPIKSVHQALCTLVQCTIVCTPPLPSYVMLCNRVCVRVTGIPFIGKGRQLSGQILTSVHTVRYRYMHVATPYRQSIHLHVSLYTGGTSERTSLANTTVNRYIFPQSRSLMNMIVSLLTVPLKGPMVTGEGVLIDLSVDVTVIV